MLIQTLIPELTVQTFTEGILSRLAWLDKAQFHLFLLAPKKHRLTGKFSPIVNDNLARQVACFCQLIKKTTDLDP